VIPTLNEGAFIERCLSAIFDLDYPDEKICVVLVDNGSNDDTVQRAEKYPIRIISVPKRNISYARNRGAYEADSDLIAFLDADCVVSRNWLLNAVKNFSDLGIIAVGSYPSLIEKESNRLQIAISRISRGGDKPRKSSWLPSANFIVLKSIFDKVGGFDEKLETCEDSDIGYRLSEIGDLIWDPSVLVYHLREPRSFIELFSKELWRSRNSIKGTLRHGLRISEFPSLIAPIIFVFGWILVIFGTILNEIIAIGGIMLITLLVCLYTVRAYLKSGEHLFALSYYFVYFFARSISFIRSLIIKD
jgi:glycosyltransferase involved in cell wall biosynthesis